MRISVGINEYKKKSHGIIEIRIIFIFILISIKYKQQMGLPNATAENLNYE